MAEQTAPQQQRSREKVSRIQEATATLLETTSYEDLGTKMIAAEAGVSVGVLYRYFADKEAIVASLVRRWLESDVEVIRQVAAEPLPANSQDLAAKMITAIADAFRTEPGRRNIWYHGPNMPTVKTAVEQSDLAIAELIHTALVRGYAVPDTPESRRRVRLAVEVVSHLLEIAFRDDYDGDPDVLADAALIVDRYLFAPPTRST